ncbi:hypothetical protein HSBAA_60730 [Vreelandella sulfidaeris]|uniref:Uncharacterized protein n=1 Tax=Vreelandella sulfidaeris TaxID=115553 RepID=A0A455UGD2_9GAMM|nr:hypothetical protein HSBAA_60730 [Halomonas sulfidaeris]
MTLLSRLNGYVVKGKVNGSWPQADRAQCRGRYALRQSPAALIKERQRGAGNGQDIFAGQPLDHEQIEANGGVICDISTTITK